MPQVSTPLLNLESLWNELNLVSSPKPLHFCGIIEQGNTPVSSQQTSVWVGEHVYAQSGGEIRSTPEQYLGE